MRLPATALLLLLLPASCARPTAARRAPAPPPPPAAASAAEDPADFDREVNAELRRQEAREDLWYGTPGVRAGGGDFFGFFRKLFTRPGELLDFDARRGPQPLDERFQRALDAMLRRYEADR